MAKLDIHTIGAEMDEFNTLNNELECDVLDREHREFDIYEGIDVDNHQDETPEDWFYDEPHYDWQEDCYDPFPYHGEDFY